SFLVCLENGLKETLFGLRPEYQNDAVANVVLTYGVYGGFYALQRRCLFDDQAIIDTVISLNNKIAELLE
ncbi:MAG TPA: hypothetical protein IAC37_11875, partial [Candidatus Ventrimonas merdavium]|nr:hypothetical protein [Candidatus Ventrimonas merdavium]